jgi:hypothetical protein
MRKLVQRVQKCSPLAEMSALLTEVVPFAVKSNTISDKKPCEETTLSAKAATYSVEGDFKKQAKIVKYSEVFC